MASPAFPRTSHRPSPLRTGEPTTHRVIGLVRETGEVRWVAVNTRLIRRAADEQPSTCLAVFHDVTDERQLEEERSAQAQAQELQNQELLEQAEALERGQALFRSLVDTAGSAIVGMRTDGTVFEWNREAEALFGVPRAEAIGRDYVSTFATADYRAQIASGIDSVLEGQVLRNLVVARQRRAWRASHGHLERHATAHRRERRRARAHCRRRGHHRARSLR